MKKISAILLSAALSLMVFTSCGNGNTPQDGGSAADTGANAVLSGEMRDISSMELVKDMGIGWNLGDTLDVC
ncbi:MAG: glycoside hydrolase family 5 protein, partial [Oscillospiraceae bacterium]|nr:glycoside hydrolase family 5 protein [Oscillospiraceae bacterium]